MHSRVKRLTIHFNIFFEINSAQIQTMLLICSHRSFCHYLSLIRKNQVQHFCFTLSEYTMKNTRAHILTSIIDDSVTRQEDAWQQDGQQGRDSYESVLSWQAD